MRKREILFLILAVLYFIAGLTGSTMVSESIRQFIGHNGWSEFNQWALAIGIPLAGVFLFLVVFRTVKQLPRPNEVIVFVSGVVVMLFYLLFFRQSVLLTTELVHIPQFMILTLLFNAAFPENWVAVLMAGAMAGVADEWAQSFLPRRILDINDIFLNWIGLFFGIVAWWSISLWVKRPQEKNLLHVG